MRVLFLSFYAATILAQPQAVEILNSGDGLSSTVALTHAGDSRIFITERGGRIKIFDGNSILPTPFLNISGIIASGGERGLLSVAFHPDYKNNGFFFVNYTRASDAATVISRWEVSTGDPNVADSGSESILLVIPQPASNHNGGQVQFGHDGYLYIGMGDGGGQNDGFCNGQDTTTLLGSILRLDIDQNVNTSPFHAIPSSNPFFGHPTNREEIWSFGFRNPWRFSFDRMTGDMFIGDVGQDTIEEIDFEPFDSVGGQNFGWPAKEGSNCFSSSCSVPLCSDPSLVDPILEHNQTAGFRSITGGYVYRGCLVESLFGKYIYSDYGVGDVFQAEETSPGNWSSSLLFDLPPWSTVAFGEDFLGELYIVALNGTIYRIEDLNPFDAWFSNWNQNIDCLEDSITVLDIINFTIN